MHILFFILSFLFLFINPVNAGLVPCFGPDCTFCHFFLLFQNLFNFAVWTMAPLIATAFIVYGGYMYLISAGNTSKLESARSILKNTVIGLLIVYGSYAIASSLIGAFAPNTEDFGFKKGVFSFSCKAVSSAVDTSGGMKDGVITVEIEEEKPIVVELTPAQVAAHNEKAIKSVDGGTGNLFKSDTGVNLNGLEAVTWGSLSAASRYSILLENDIKLMVTSAKRDVSKQNSIVSQNCPKGATSSSACNPVTCIPKDTNKDGAIDGKNCPHISGQAVDVHGWKDGKQCPDSSDCQTKVISVMKAQGFCVLNSEPWHFEKPKVSSTCN